MDSPVGHQRPVASGGDTRQAAGGDTFVFLGRCVRYALGFERPFLPDYTRFFRAVFEQLEHRCGFQSSVKYAGS